MIVQNIKYIVIDVDGTLTDAGIYYDENGNEIKKFCTRDGVGFLVARRLGIQLVVITGRECAATTKRMKEMKIDYLFQNIHNKYTFLKEFMKEKRIKKNELAYVGDDVNDLQAMKLAGYIGCPADSAKEIKAIASYISPVNGGHGVFRDVLENLLSKKGTDVWEKAVLEVYGNDIENRNINIM